jgi:hypothetical protein
MKYAFEAVVYSTMDSLVNKLIRKGIVKVIDNESVILTTQAQINASDESSITVSATEDDMYVSNKNVKLLKGSLDIHGRSEVSVEGAAVIVAHGMDVHVRATQNSHVVLLNGATCEAYGRSEVTAYDNSRAVACDDSHVEAYDSVSVYASYNAYVMDNVLFNGSVVLKDHAIGRFESESAHIEAHDDSIVYGTSSSVKFFDNARAL